MTDWLVAPYYTDLPDPAPQFYMNGPFLDVREDIEYGMGLLIDGDLKSPNEHFSNNPAQDPQYHDPIAYGKNLAVAAANLQQSDRYYMPEGWTPARAAVKYANICFDILRKIPCNRGAENSNNLFDSWVAGTGQNYAGLPDQAPIGIPEGESTK